MPENSNLIMPAHSGNVRRQARDNNYSPKAAYIPARASTPIGISRSAAGGRGGFRRAGNVTSVGGGNSVGTGGAGHSIAQSPLFYDYRYSTPDKYYFPRDRATANSVWRDVYRRDAAVATATDMYAELPWSQFDIEGIDDPEVRKVYEDMFTDLNLIPVLDEFTRDYLLTGEFIPHAIYDTTKGYWTRIISHNPDYVEVMGLGVVAEQPLMWLKATPEVHSLLKSSDPRVRKLLQSLPAGMVNSFRSKGKVALDPLNTTYLARKSVSYDIRGESVYTRLFRINMYEDFVMNCSLAVSQRNAAPVRLFKLGDPNPGGWMPLDEDIDALSELLSLAESDPLAAIVTHPHIAVDYVGVSDKAMLISREWDFIERVKLLALGVSRAFLVGETSFAAAIAGLQNLLERLAALRLKFEQEWILPKLCAPIAQMHGFYKRRPTELENRIRIDRPDDRQLMIPKLHWHKNLDPTQDPSILGVWRDLKERGIISDRTYATGAGVDIEVERRNLIEEQVYTEKVRDEEGIVLDPAEDTDGYTPPPAPDGASGIRKKKGTHDVAIPGRKGFRLQVPTAGANLLTG